MGQSFFEKRRNGKALRQLQAIEQAEGRELSIVAFQGTQKFQWSNTASVMLSIFLVMFVVAAMFGYFIFPGGLLFVFAYNAVKPRRTVSLNRDVVTVWEHSTWLSKVTSPVVSQPRSFLEFGSFVTVPGALPVDLSSNETEALLKANAEFGPAPVVPVRVPPAPSAPNQSLV